MCVDNSVQVQISSMTNRNSTGDPTQIITEIRLQTDLLGIKVTGLPLHAGSVLTGVSLYTVPAVVSLIKAW